tara:strand:+ start:3242 stop:4003 length:762 start_codon:yes stop_codon:yes gene_type:complete
MTNVKVPASGNIRVWFALPNAFANYESPTAAELNACLDISDSISWNDFGFALSASNTIDDPAITAMGKVADRGAPQFGGTISFYYPGAFGDASNDYSVTYDALDQTRTAGYIVMRMDGDQPVSAAAAGDLVEVFKVLTDGYAESITGEEAFRYTITFLPQGDLAIRCVVAGGSAPVVSIDPATLAVAVASHTRVSADVDGRVYTNGLQWTSSANAIASVSHAGVITANSAGTATITATYEATGATATCAVTVS